ncbi:MAG: Ribonuclease PH [Alphaproteobacteria bacterium MarineAlpha5_Bin8]|nr:MAG: Ribonuclease PH [Alphaproteobacteria bacterium MarineAlpha5_Bin7]PPR48153.1 MAG: Ribonuclease PH [Alphaproteobacteria bacterium MarineAlpha5_Bin8]PPR54728.1 MAG: Ribonuclease PH [Alphaproteobacteria bacterium MarineAlpha5_Bin6]|tara:strand:- start:1339 stop:2052 length:714 start_codon:yes stop_codon:yes gene_type:complete
MRQDRNFEELRPISFEIDVNIHAEGSCLVKFGNTHVLCTASIDEKTPHWLKNTGKGWVTAEYGMLPRSTNTRIDREASKGKQSGRTQEIQRLIGRSLRSVVNLENIGERQIKIDCDVIQADGGTRTASISGGFVALYQSVLQLKKNYNIQKPIISEFVAAVSAGIVQNNPSLDLDYNEDARAQVDANFIICENEKISEIQVTGEEYFFSENQFQSLFGLAKKGVKEIIKKQKEILKM